jgi:hypothetical protein
VRRLIQPTGPATRIQTAPGRQVGLAAGIPVFEPHQWLEILHLPPRRPNVVVVVSQIVALGIAELYPTRDDVVHPGTAPGDGAVRESGRGVVSISRLIRAV